MGWRNVRTGGHRCRGAVSCSLFLPFCLPSILNPSSSARSFSPPLVALFGVSLPTVPRVSPDASVGSADASRNTWQNESLVSAGTDCRRAPAVSQGLEI